MFFPTTTVSIFRDTDDSEQVHRGRYTARPIATEVPASIIEQTALFPSNVDRNYSADTIIGRLDPSIDVRDGDEVLDERTNRRYSVIGVVEVDTFIAHTKKMNLRAAN